MSLLEEYMAARQSALRQSRLQGRERAILLAADACIAALLDKNKWLENCWRDSLAEVERLRWTLDYAITNYGIDRAGYFGGRYEEGHKP